MTTQTATPTETVEIDGITYTVDRSEYEIESSQTTLCVIDGPRGACAFIIRSHGGGYIAMTATLKTKLARTSTHTLSAIFAPLFPVTADEQTAIDDWKAAGGERLTRR